MPSKNSDGLRLLVRREPLTKEDWIKMIEARRALIKPHLDSISFGTLGKFVGEFYSVSRPQRKSLRELFVCLVDDGVFSTQGHFRLMDQRWIGEEIRYEPVWGLTRSGDWFYATGIYTRRFGDGNYHWQPQSFCVTDSIGIHTQNLVERLRLDVENSEEMVYWELEKMIKDVTEKRRCLYEELKAVRNIMMAENAALSLIPPK